MVGTNGTIVNDETISTGQIFFGEELSETIMKLEPYASHTGINRTLSSVGEFLRCSGESGRNVLMSEQTAFMPVRRLMGGILIWRLRRWTGKMSRRGWWGILLLVLILLRLLEDGLVLRLVWIGMQRFSFLDVEEQEVNKKIFET